MFNSYHAGNTNIKINAVTGAILKNHPNSWFERFNLNSERAKHLLSEGGDKGREWTGYSYKDNPNNAITVLQMVICGDMEVMAELVYTKDYEMKIGDN
jgi:hypothetical protein